MKKRNINLDFTSLLDVTLIIIFFFVLFGHLDNQEKRARIDQKVEELQMEVQQAEEREIEAEALKKQLESELAIVKRADEREAENISEMLEYNRSGNIKMILDFDSNGWSMRILHGLEVIYTIKASDMIEEDLIKAFHTADLDYNKTVFCEFVFDGSAAGSRDAYQKIKSAIEEIRKKFCYLYVSETDTSIGGE